jgi:hypothetical protein
LELADECLILVDECLEPAIASLVTAYHALDFLEWNLLKSMA